MVSQLPWNDQFDKIYISNQETSKILMLINVYFVSSPLVKWLFRLDFSLHASRGLDSITSSV